VGSSKKEQLETGGERQNLERTCNFYVVGVLSSSHHGGGDELMTDGELTSQKVHRLNFPVEARNKGKGGPVGRNSHGTFLGDGVRTRSEKLKKRVPKSFSFVDQWGIEEDPYGHVLLRVDSHRGRKKGFNDKVPKVMREGWSEIGNET